MKKVEFFFDIGSPYSYLAFHRLLQLKANIIWRPMLLGGVFQATGNRSPVETPAKRAYSSRDMQLFAKLYGVTFKMPTVFPINTLPFMRGATGYLMKNEAAFLPYVTAIYTAMFETARDMSDVSTILSEKGLNPDDFTAYINDAEVKAALKTTTEEAVARGVFGAPTFFVGDEMFFGQDRLIFIEPLIK